VDGTIEEDDAVIQQQIADGHLSLSGVFASGHGGVIESRILHFPFSCETINRPKKTGVA